MDKMNHLSSSALVAETADIAKNVAIATQNAALTDDYLTTKNTLLKTNAATMVKGIGTKRGKELKDELDASDARRDALFSALMYFLKGYLRWDKEPTAGAAGRILTIVKSHDEDIPRLSIENESAMLESILESFTSEEAVQAITTLNLTELVADLRSEQGHLSDVYQQSAKLESEKPEVIAPSNIKRETLAIINDMIDYLTAMNKANNAVYGALTANVAELVNSLNIKIRTRYTSSTTSTENS
ncbi:DUF6261 family protein [Prolixibacter sp. SD074]|jgi:hypothetical protein|uniref:DUF6261 family protein n=1 Tax=Prolixibacter sp. SD074 TaxID=2652391 RepID=UPI00127D6DB1|nr:DUF6261 family protein [Prolixibacter sp. SD074]GET28306.1 hypothetical protein SD074_05080 [Prolixibacter sp. SD074]